DPLDRLPPVLARAPRRPHAPRAAPPGHRHPRAPRRGPRLGRDPRGSLARSPRPAAAPPAPPHPKPVPDRNGSLPYHGPGTPRPSSTTPAPASSATRSSAGARSARIPRALAPTRRRASRTPSPEARPRPEREASLLRAREPAAGGMAAGGFHRRESAVYGTRKAAGGFWRRVRGRATRGVPRGAGQCGLRHVLVVPCGQGGWGRTNDSRRAHHDEHNHTTPQSGGDRRSARKRHRHRLGYRGPPLGG